MLVGDPLVALFQGDRGQIILVVHQTLKLRLRKQQETIGPTKLCVKAPLVIVHLMILVKN